MTQPKTCLLPVVPSGRTAARGQSLVAQQRPIPAPAATQMISSSDSGREPDRYPPSRRAHVLLIEDDARLRQALRLALADEGFEMSEAANGHEGLRQLAHRPDIVLLDLVLPDADGLDVLRRIRAATDLPLIIVSGRTDSRDVVRGLHDGADDYVTKPVVAQVLIARIEALLRRAHPGCGPEEVRLSDVVVHPDKRTVYKNGREVRLTKTEFRLLCELAAAAGDVVTREQLLMRVWGYDYFGDTRLLDVHIRRLRAKVEDDPGDPKVVLTVRGVGYRVQP